MTHPINLSKLPNRPGVGYKPQHFPEIHQDAGSVEWLEIHAENYMGDGGRPLAQLRALAEKFPFSVHGVGLSIGGEPPLDRDHLARLKYLVDWLKPASFSEHLAWATHDTHFMNDLLPLPYTAETLNRVCDHVSLVQDTIGRQMLLENPSSYLAFAESTFDEPEFLYHVADRTGCGMLLDVNNVFVSANNLKIDAFSYIDTFPLDKIGELHLGGHHQDTDENGDLLLIDSHGHPVIDPVWALYQYTLEKTGPKPTLIEWDDNVPDWAVLENEAKRASEILNELPS